MGRQQKREKYFFRFKTDTSIRIVGALFTNSVVLKIGDFLILTLEVWLFYEPHGTAFRLGKNFGLFLTQPPHLTEEETEAEDLVDSEYQASL